MRHIISARKAVAVCLLVAFISLFAVSSLFRPGYAAAAGQVTTRSITMSNSTPSATGVSYALTFTPATSETELVVDFCNNSPLIGDSCSFTTATVPDVSSATVSTGTLTKPGTGTPKHTLAVTGLTLTAGNPYTITFNNIINPATSAFPGTFYARVLTYATGGASGYVPGNTSPASPTLGSYVDYGGIALSTAQTINITAKVYETLSFCVFKTACGTSPTLTLGDTTTGALSTTSAYSNSQAQYTLSTNASGGVKVNMFGTTLCRATVVNSTNCPTGASGNTISAMTTNTTKSLGNEQFGMCIDVNGSSALTVPVPYDDTSAGNCHSITTGTYNGANTFGLDDTSSSGTNSTGGDTVMQSSGAVPTVTGSFAFLADVASTTEAGIYQSNLNMVATATF